MGLHCACLILDNYMSRSGVGGVRLNHLCYVIIFLLLRFVIVNNVHIPVIMTIVFMTLSGILQYDMIGYYLFVTYDICVRARNSKLGWGVINTMFSHCAFTVYSFIFFFDIGLLPVGYISYYTIVAYDICVMVSVGR